MRSILNIGTPAACWIDTAGGTGRASTLSVRHKERLC